MITFGLNSSNDIYLGTNGNLTVLTGLNAVISACETISRTQLGEMVLSTKKGIPNFQALWVGVPNYPIWKTSLRKALESVANVIEVATLELSLKNNILSYTATIRTIYGNSQITG